MVGFEALHVLVDADAGGDREAAQPVGLAAFLRGDEIAQAVVRFLVLAAVQLLAQMVQRHERLVVAGLAVQMDVVHVGMGGPEADHAAGSEPLFVDDFIQHLAGVVVELGGFHADHFVFQDARELAGQLPGAEEGRPVDALHQLVQGVLLEHLEAFNLRLRRRVIIPVRLEAVLAGLLDADQRAVHLLLLAAYAQVLVGLFDLRHIVRFLGFRQQA